MLKTRLVFPILVIPQLQQVAVELELRRGQEGRAIERLRSLKSALCDGPDWNVQMAELSIAMEKIEQGRRHLSHAQKALRGMREMPARTQLTQRIVALEASLHAK